MSQLEEGVMEAQKMTWTEWPSSEAPEPLVDLVGRRDPDATISLLSMVLPTDWPLEPWLDWLEGRQR